MEKLKGLLHYLLANSLDCILPFNFWHLPSDAYADWCCTHGKQQYEVGSKEYLQIQYSYRVMWLAISKSILILLAAWPLGFFWQTACLMAAYLLLRHKSMGFHLDHYLPCLLVAAVYQLGGTWASIVLRLPLLVLLAVYGLAALCCLRYAPAASDNSPVAPNLVKPKKLAALRLLADYTLLTITLYTLGLYTWANLFVVASLCASLDILPITYKVFRKTYYPRTRKGKSNNETDS